MTPEDPDGEPPAGHFSPEAVLAAGRRAGKPQREFSVDLYGRERTDAGRHAGSPLCSMLRRPVRRTADAGLSGAGSRLPGRR